MTSSLVKSWEVPLTVDGKSIRSSLAEQTVTIQVCISQFVNSEPINSWPNTSRQGKEVLDFPSNSHLKAEVAYTYIDQKKTNGRMTCADASAQNSTVTQWSMSAARSSKVETHMLQGKQLGIT